MAGPLLAQMASGQWIQGVEGRARSVRCPFERRPNRKVCYMFQYILPEGGKMGSPPKVRLIRQPALIGTRKYTKALLWLYLHASYVEHGGGFSRLLVTYLII